MLSCNEQYEYLICCEVVQMHCRAEATTSPLTCVCACVSVSVCARARAPLVHVFVCAYVIFGLWVFAFACVLVALVCGCVWGMCGGAVCRCVLRWWTQRGTP